MRGRLPGVDRAAAVLAGLLVGEPAIRGSLNRLSHYVNLNQS
jgi:hypothetical protein